MKHNNHSAHNHKGHDGVPHNHQEKEKHSKNGVSGRDSI